MIYFLSIVIFSVVILALVGLLLVVEATVVKKGDRQILINDDPEKIIRTPSGRTLLSVLTNNGVFLPSACGGGGACGLCKCKVDSGGGDVLPTELPHLSRKEKKEKMRLACQLKVKEDLKIRVPDEIFNIKRFHGTVISNDNVATFIKELVVKLDPGENLAFTAGAYMQIDIPEYEVSFTQFDIPERFIASWDRFRLRKLKAKSEEPVYRAYSLANPPAEKNLLRFTIRIATPPAKEPELPPGKGSSYIFNLKRGDQLTLSGPYGEFFVKETDREMCFVGGGAGMAPMRCHILHQLNTINTKRKMTFWYGARSKAEMFYDDDFKALDAKFDNFSYYVALSEPQPEDNWSGLTGYIHQCLKDNYLSTHKDPTEIEYYLCGPPMMLDAVLAMLDSFGVGKEMIAFDKF